MTDNLNLFGNLKKFYEITFQNMDIVIKQQNNMIKSFIESQPGMYKFTLLSLHNEWAKNCEKTLNDYKDILFKGLDYMDNFCTNKKEEQ